MRRAHLNAKQGEIFSILAGACFLVDMQKCPLYESAFGSFCLKVSDQIELTKPMEKIWTEIAM